MAPQDPFLGALLTGKPRLVVLNVDMDSAGGGNEKSARMVEHLGEAPHVVLSAELEREARLCERVRSLSSNASEGE